MNRRSAEEERSASEPELDLRSLSRRTRRLGRVGRVRFGRVDRLLRNIETAPTQKVPMETVPLETGDFISDFIRLPRSTSPAGSVSLDVACDRHGGRLMRLWMSRQARGATLFGGEGRDEAWDTDTTGRGAVVVKCTRPGCRGTARLTNDWLEARLLHVRADFEAGQGLPIARIPLSQVGVF